MQALELLTRTHRPRLERSIAGAMWVVGAALALRLVDVFVLRLDELLGEIVLSKALGLGLVALAVVATRTTASELGLDRASIRRGAVAGTVVSLAAFGTAIATQVLVLPDGATLAVRAVDPTTGLSGGVLFAAWLILGNVLNATMEEGMFRGLLLARFRRRLSARAANLLQAGLFAGWHMVWPAKDLVNGARPGQVLPEAGMLLLASFVAGLAYAQLREATGSLWTPWVVHLTNNTVLNLVHVRTAGGDVRPAQLVAVLATTVVALIAAGLAVRHRHERRPTPCH